MVFYMYFIGSLLYSMDYGLFTCHSLVHCYVRVGCSSCTRADKSLGVAEIQTKTKFNIIIIFDGVYISHH